MTKSISRRSVLSLLGVTLALAPFFAGCGGDNGGTDNAAPAPNGNGTGGNATTTSANPQTVTIGYNAAIVQPQPLLGLEGDYAQKIPGVTFKGTALKAGPDVIEALRAGTIDIGCSGAWPAMRAFAKDGDVVLLSGCASGGTQLVVAKDSPIKSIKDLKGKTIGVNQRGSTVETMVLAQLVDAGLNPATDVKLVAVEPAEQADALKLGQIDAAAAPAPWPSFAEKTVGARALLNGDQMFNNGNYLQGSLYTTKRFAQAHPDFIKAFLAANDAITKDLNADLAKGDARVLAAWSKASGKKLDPAVAQAAFKTIHFTTAADPKGLQQFADLAFKVGILKKKADLTGFVYKP